MSRPACLFDLDGTLTDPRQGIVHCIRHAFSELEREPPPERELLSWIGPPLQASFLRAFSGCEESAERAIATYRAHFDQVGWRQNRSVPTIERVLHELVSAGLECYVATSKPRVFAERIVTHFGFDRWIGRVYGSELDGRRCEKTDLIRHALADAGLRAADTVMIGDREHDVTGALACKVTPIGVLWGFGTREELSEAGAEAIAVHPGELVPLCLETPALRHQDHTRQQRVIY